MTDENPIGAAMDRNSQLNRFPINIFDHTSHNGNISGHFNLNTGYYQSILFLNNLKQMRNISYFLRVSILFPIILIFGCNSQPQSQRPEDSDDSCKKYNFQIWIDPSGKTAPDEAFKQTFERLNRQFLDLDFTYATVWLKASGKPENPGQRCYIVLEWPTLTKAEFFALDEFGRSGFRGQAGAILPRSQWAIPWIDYPSFPILGEKEILIRINTWSLMRFPIAIRSETEMREQMDRRVFYTSLYAGFMAAVCLFALFFFFVLRDQIYLFYGGYLFSVSINFSFLYSSAPRILWPEFPFWQTHGLFFTQAIALYFAVAFFREFVDLRMHFPKLDKIAIGLLVFAIASAFGSFISNWNVFFSRIFSVVYLFWIPGLLAITVRLLLNNQKHLLIFAITWGTFYSAAFLYILWVTRVVPPFPFFFYALVWLLPFEAIFFAASIYQRYRSIDSTRKRLELEMKAALDRLAEFSAISSQTSNDSSKKEIGKYRRSKIHNMNVAEILRNIERLFVAEMIYLDEDLSLSSLSQRLGLTPHQLSEICNTHLKTTFPRLLSYYRIQHAMTLLKNSRDWNILQVGYESGFKSKAAFNSDFKRFTGITPKQFRQSQFDDTF
ncbi:7TM diverse intracellular signaling [Leptospira broomii serovar Hurstbridge str. 5399]|uniref:7TM diverse intracellular signaling n=1 Tax=Leptospira broomii serovar Hurstbridge str. 5399 TaxID=1049789 RepID=T0GKM3_9LEPT|nr:7TM diverse intracellular signaling domain-containing protein [Leptospira broomii]EQA47344.1 7TM diverse intracellular signaling [Leptospira broomii serovar Hurstbridge str. 5399]